MMGGLEQGLHLQTLNNSIKSIFKLSDKEISILLYQSNYEH